MKRALHATLFVAALGLGACTNETTPEGHEGYIVHVPLIFGKAYHVGNQTGPTSTGLVWRQFVTNVDMRPKSYAEEFHILSRDNLNVGFEAHVRISLAAGGVDEIAELLGGLPAGTAAEDATALPEWYTRNVQQPYRAAVRDVVHGYDAYDIQAQTQAIGAEIMSRLQEDWADSAVTFEAVSIGNIAYPEEINQEIQRKLAAEQDLDRMQRERQIAEQEAQIAVTTARGRAAAQRIVNETLTPLYVQHEMLEGMHQLSRTPRATIIATPADERSGAPILLGLGN